VVCTDDPVVKRLLPRFDRRIVTYGTEDSATYRVQDIRPGDDFSVSFDVFEKEFLLGRAKLRMPGAHNALNALAAVAVGRELGLGSTAILRALETFDGVARRFEIKGEENGVLVVDDYGHHPNEITAVLRAAREHSSRRVVVLFQPHRFSRTVAHLDEFASCFSDADLVFVAPIYPAGEEPVVGISGQTIVDRVREQGHPDCRYVDDLDALPRAVQPELQDGDLVITLGAGSIYRSGERLLEELVQHGSGAKA
jgi:UDP-N-acetylmuramate--alanine ligase